MSWPRAAAAGLLLLTVTHPPVSAQAGEYTFNTDWVLNPNPKLCACNQEGQIMACISQVVAECEAAGAYANAVPMCRADWSQGPAVLASQPYIFLDIIKMSAVKCQHPYTFTVEQQASFLGATMRGRGPWLVEPLVPTSTRRPRVPEYSLRAYPRSPQPLTWLTVVAFRFSRRINSTKGLFLINFIRLTCEKGFFFGLPGSGRLFADLYIPCGLYEGGSPTV
jgi:hypothetical protein